VRVDPRFIIGVVLVAASIGGVFAIVSSIDDTTEIYAARGTLVVGQKIERTDLVVRDVRLGAGGADYLSEADIPEDGLVMVRTVEDGELVPASAVSSRSDAAATTIVIAVSGRLPASVRAGTVVDVWSADRIDNSSFGEPAVLVPRASIVAIREPDGLVAGGQSVTVDVLVPRERIAALLESLADDDALSIVPAAL
jgi:hypothetical protein